MTDPQPWVTLHPKLDPSGTGLRIVAATVDALDAVDWTLEEAVEEIRQIRRQSLAALRTQPITQDHQDAIARICVAVLCDLRGQGWAFRMAEGGVQARKPKVDPAAPTQEKARVRTGLLLERDQVLCEPSTRQFVARMERRRRSPHGEWISIYSLMRDGSELAQHLHQAAMLAEGTAREEFLRGVIRPYLQPVDDSRCAHTGFALKDIWRYFRLTWTNAPKTVPGRNVWFLVRDAAVRHHPVIGIAALGSAIVQLTVRDRWIGWHGDDFVASLARKPSDRWAQWVERSLAEQIAGLYLADFLAEGIVTEANLEDPSPSVIQRLRDVGAEAREKHHLYPKSAEHKSTVQHDSEWQAKAETHLFRYKRATTLAALLEAKLRLRRAGFHAPDAKHLAAALSNREGRSAIKDILRRVKAAHVGIDMMDITICGAIQPYNALLGGKLVSLLMASPQVAAAYCERYGDTASIIASSMAGRAVRRPPRLVLLGTTSLYGVGSSQYNRVRMPASAAGGATDTDIRYYELGHTLGFGSFHFSNDTLAEFDRFWAHGHGARVVNSIFGEGVNPRLRKIRDVLDAVGLSGDHILHHGDKRIVYGVPLASNFKEMLLGVEHEPQPILPGDYPVSTTQSMADFWLRRWLAPRVTNPVAVEQVAQHTLIYPVTHGARVALPSYQDGFSETLPLSDPVGYE